MFNMNSGLKAGSYSNLKLAPLKLAHKITIENQSSPNFPENCSLKTSRKGAKKPSNQGLLPVCGIFCVIGFDKLCNIDESTQ